MALRIISKSCCTFVGNLNNTEKEITVQYILNLYKNLNLKKIVITKKENGFFRVVYDKKKELTNFYISEISN